MNFLHSPSNHDPKYQVLRQQSPELKVLEEIYSIIKVLEIYSITKVLEIYSIIKVLEEIYSIIKVFEKMY